MSRSSRPRRVIITCHFSLSIRNRLDPPSFFSQKRNPDDIELFLLSPSGVYRVHPLIRTHRTYTLTLTVGGRCRASNACPRSGGLSNGVSCRLEWIRCISFTFTSERGSALGITPMPSILFPLCSPSLSCKSRVNISASLKFPSTSFESFRIYACFGSLPSRNAYVRSIQRCIIV